MDLTTSLPKAETTLAESLLARVASLVETSTSKFDLIETLGAELGLNDADLFWYCGKYKRFAADKVGEASCRTRQGSETHRAVKWGCSYRIMLPSKIV